MKTSRLQIGLDKCNKTLTIPSWRFNHHVVVCWTHTQLECSSLEQSISINIPNISHYHLYIHSFYHNITIRIFGTNYQFDMFEWVYAANPVYIGYNKYDWQHFLIWSSAGGFNLCMIWWLGMITPNSLWSTYPKTMEHQNVSWEVSLDWAIFNLVCGSKPSETNMSSSVGIMKFPRYGKINFLFQTTNQVA